VQAGESYIVGERQPELFVPRQSGTILPSVPQGGSTEVNVYSSEGQPEVRRTRNGNNGERIDIIFDKQAKRAVANGTLDKEMRSRYGITPQTRGA
jgi:phage-related minor tail protein